MALRLTTPQAAPQTDRRTPAELHELAAARIVAKDFDGFDALWADTARSSDVHRRYRSRVVLVEAALKTAGEVSNQAAAALFLRLVKCLLPALEENPREPMLVSLLGVSF